MSLEQDDLGNNVTNNSTNTDNILSSSTNYRYTVDNIEKFFASDNEQEEEHSLEDSICRPLIGLRSNKPFFYYCKIDPKVENINLKSIEDHIRLKDPQRHKAKLLELIQQNEKIDAIKKVLSKQ